LCEKELAISFTLGALQASILHREKIDFTIKSIIEKLIEWHFQ